MTPQTYMTCQTLTNKKKTRIAIKGRQKTEIIYGLSYQSPFNMPTMAISRHITSSRAASHLIIITCFSLYGF